MSTNRRVKAADMASVVSVNQLKQHIATIGQLQSKIDFATAQTNLMIDKIKADLAENVKAANDEIKVLHKACQVYFSANQADIVPAGKKSVAYTEGEIGTRTTPMSVTIKKDQKSDLIEELITRGLEDCVSITKTPNKNALKKVKSQVEDIPGITFNQREEFFIEPLLVEPNHTKLVED